MLGLYFKEAYRNLISAKLRSALAILGILVGTASVVAMVSSGKLATAEALKQFEVLGTDLMSVTINPKGKEAQTQLSLFTTAKAMSLQHVPEVKHVAPYISNYAAVRFHGHRLDGATIGATEALQKVIKIDIKEGRFISDLDKYSQFCVLGNEMYKKILAQTGIDPLHKQIEVGTEIFTVVGIAAPWPENSFFYQNINRAVLVPIDASRILSKYAQIKHIVFYLQKDIDIDKVQNKLKGQLGGMVRGSKLFFRSAKQVVESMQKQSHIFTLLLGMIGGISLLVGGIGVMNIMLVSVVERKREIGIRKALGARRKDIQSLFLIESISLSLFGGLLGVGSGILIAFVIAKFSHWDFMIFLMPPLIGFLVSFAIGVFFGFYPAYKAARSDPIECLRTD